ncbi:MAG: galactitol-1-phosphate 5-dehydrogenase [Firmicutes bacterium]|nr:galactitol-1-phosphate 5-dehydrogenase [Bacillota bacterium]
MKAAVLHAPGLIKCEEVPIPRLSDGEALVKVKAAGVCGSDIRRVMVTGTYHFPTIPGHEFAGEVVEVAGEIGDVGVRPGDRVVVIPLIPCGRCDFCQVGDYALCDDYNYLGSRTDGGFAEYVKAPIRNLIHIPAGVDYETAAATEPAAVALHGLRRARGIKPGDSVAVLGAGPIGILVAQWARALGAKEVYLVDTVVEKLDLAMRLDFAPENCIDAGKADPIQAIKDRTGGRGVSLVVEAAGVPATLKGALEMAGKGGRVLLLGNPQEDVVLPAKLISGILRKQLALYGTWNSEFRPHPVNEWELTLNFMARGLIKVLPLISHRFSLEDVAEAFDMMYHKRQVFNRVFFIPG